MLEELYVLNTLLKGKATIAGGCFKDILLDKEPKDIDIFLIDDKESTLKFVKEVVSDFTGIEPIIDDFGVIKYSMYTIIPAKIVKGRKLFGVPSSLLSTFDFNIAKLYLDEYNNISTIDSEDINIILDDIENKRYCVTLYTGHEDRTHKRIERYREYGFIPYKTYLHTLDNDIDNGRY